MAKLRSPISSLNEGTDEPDTEPVTTVTAVVPEQAVQQAPVAGISVTDLAQAFATALEQQRQGHVTDMSSLIEKARSRRPESFKGDFPYPNISVFNPDGDAKPCPDLKCEMWEGILDTTVKPPVPRKGHVLEKGDLGPLTKREVRLLNHLTEGVYTVENRDGERAPVHVSIDRAANGAPQLLIIAYPMNWMDKAGKNRKPAVTDVCRQILGIEGGTAAIDAWLDTHDPALTAA